MMLIITCARGVRGKFDKNDGVWCILSVPKLVIINLKKGSGGGGGGGWRLGRFLHNCENDLPYQSSIQSRLAC